MDLALLLSQVLWEAELTAQQDREEPSEARPPAPRQAEAANAPRPPCLTPRPPEASRPASSPQASDKTSSARRLSEAKAKDNAAAIQAAWSTKHEALSKSEAFKQQHLKE